MHARAIDQSIERGRAAIRVPTPDTKLVDGPHANPMAAPRLEACMARLFHTGLHAKLVEASLSMVICVVGRYTLATQSQTVLATCPHTFRNQPTDGKCKSCQAVLTKGKIPQESYIFQCSRLAMSCPWQSACVRQ